MRIRRSLAAGVALLASLAGLSTTAAGPTIEGRGATVERVATRVPSPPGPGAGRPSILISDSAWLGIHTYGGGIDTVQGFEHLLAFGSCRRRVTPSCTNYDGYVPPTLLRQLDLHPATFGTLIVATGYNDDDRFFRDDVHTIVTRARELGYERVVWLTLRSDVAYVSPEQTGFAQVFRNNNAVLFDIVESREYPELFVADWADYARDRHEWFANDGIHLRRRGSYAAGDYISRKMAHLDARPCPQPLGAGRPIADPCPDPDLQGPLVDLDSLYPVDAVQPRVPFLLRFEGSSSWPDPPWWDG